MLGSRRRDEVVVRRYPNRAPDSYLSRPVESWSTLAGVASACMAALPWGALLLATALNLAIAVLIVVLYAVVGLFIFTVFIGMLWGALTNP